MLLLAFRGELLPLTVQPPALVELFQLPPRMRARKVLTLVIRHAPGNNCAERFYQA